MTDQHDTDRARDLISRARSIRRDAGVPIGRMADQADVAKSTLSRWERTPPASGLADPGRWWQARPWIAALAVLDATNGQP
jgi:hypothetical protein